MKLRVAFGVFEMRDNKAYMVVEAVYPDGSRERRKVTYTIDSPPHPAALPGSWYVDVLAASASSFTHKIAG